MMSRTPVNYVSIIESGIRLQYMSMPEALEGKCVTPTSIFNRQGAVEPLEF